MRNIFLSILVLVCTSSYSQDTLNSAPAAVSNNYLNEYELDINKSKVLWFIETTRGVQSGEIKFKVGELLGDESSQKLGPSTLTIDMTSITCTSVPPGIANTQIVLTLKTDNFFDAYRYPFSYLKFVKISGPADGNLYSIKGLMTIKGVENAIEFTAVGKFHDGLFEGVAKNISIDRESFGIAFVRQGVDNDVVQQINKALDPQYQIDVYIVAEKK